MKRDANLHKLTARFVETVKTKGKYGDGGGLYLQVGKDGLAKSWIFRFDAGGRHFREKGLGSLHTIGLAEAREQARQCRKQRLQGIDPIEAHNADRLAKRLADAKDVTFGECIEGWIKRNSEHWTPRVLKHRKSSTKRYLEPKLGKLPISAINVDLCEEVLMQCPPPPQRRGGRPLSTQSPLWGTRTGLDIQQQLEAILDWARAKGFRTGDNPADLKGPLGERLKPYKHISKPYDSVPIEQMGAYMAQVCECVDKRYEKTKERPLSTFAYEFLIRTAVRKEQVTGAKWTEIEGNIWTCPPERHKSGKKTGKPYVIPLSRQAMAIRRTVSSPSTSSRMVFLKTVGVLPPGLASGCLHPF
jgi:integrase